MAVHLSHIAAIALKERRETLEYSWPLSLHPRTGFSSAGDDGFIKIIVGMGNIQRGMLSRSTGAKGKRPMLWAKEEKN